eukprot:2753068-Prorocentrum_lima.AAC.1
MTSSLVGSEMCIRDRNKNHQSVFDISSTGKDARQQKVAGVFWWVTMMAVSYTHLTLPTICSV